MLAETVPQLQQNDTFVLDAMYEVSGGKHVLPEDVTLAAVDGGGFDIVDAMDNSDPLFFLSNGVTIRNVTFTVSSAPQASTDKVRTNAGEHYARKTIIASFGAEDVVIDRSRFDGHVAMQIDIRTGRNITISRTHFTGGKSQMRWLGDIRDIRVESSIFEGAVGDGIKTVDHAQFGPRDILVSDSLFIANNRDGIDTTGGFQDALVTRTVFRDNGVSGLDIKEPVLEESDVNEGSLNRAIRIMDSEFIDTNSGLVFTLIDKAGIVTLENAPLLIPNDVVVENSIFEASHGQTMRAFFVKDGYNINWHGVMFLGDVRELRLTNEQAPAGWTAYNVGGSYTTGAPRGMATQRPDAGPRPGGEFPSQ